jgi:hypothetical protein
MEFINLTVIRFGYPERNASAKKERTIGPVLQDIMNIWIMQK